MVDTNHAEKCSFFSLPQHCVGKSTCEAYSKLQSIWHIAVGDIPDHLVLALIKHFTALKEDVVDNSTNLYAEPLQCL